MVDRQQPNLPDVEFDLSEPFECSWTGVQQVVCTSCEGNSPSGCPVLYQNGYVFTQQHTENEYVCLGRKGLVGLTVDHNPRRSSK